MERGFRTEEKSIRGLNVKCDEIPLKCIDDEVHKLSFLALPIRGIKSAFWRMRSGCQQFQSDYLLFGFVDISSTKQAISFALEIGAFVSMCIVARSYPSLSCDHPESPSSDLNFTFVAKIEVHGECRPCLLIHSLYTIDHSPRVIRASSSGFLYGLTASRWIIRSLERESKQA